MSHKFHYTISTRIGTSLTFRYNVLQDSLSHDQEEFQITWPESQDQVVREFP